MRLLAASLVCWLSLAGCAKVGDPLPPLVVIPKATADLKLVQLGTTARLSFPISVPDIRSVLVYKQCGPEVPWSDALEPIATLEVAQLTPQPQTPPAPPLYVYTDPGVTSGCRYSLRYVSVQKRRSLFSNAAPTSPIAAPAPPTHLQAESRADGILVTWDPPVADVTGQPTQVAGYLVSGKDFVSVPRFLDPKFEFGKPSAYRVQAVSRAKNPLTVSEPSEEVSLTPVDVFGPSAPQGVVGLFTEEKVQLVWEAVSAGDLKGYRIYRGIDPGRLEKIADLITENTFTDTQPPPGDAVYYQVSAVDQLGNEGKKSAASRVDRPRQ